MNSSEKPTSLCMVAIMAALVILVIVQSSIDVVVAMRSGWPFRHPSPKKLPGPRIAMTASLPCSEMTVSLTLPFWMKKTASATSPWEKTTCPFRYLVIVFPSPTLARNILGSNEALAFALQDLGRLALLLTESPPLSDGAASTASCVLDD